MSIYQFVLSTVAFAVIVVCWPNRRGIAWVLAGQISLYVSVAYWRSGLDYPEAVAALCDASICAAILFFAKRRWELWVCAIFQTSMLVNMIYLFSHIFGFPQIDHVIYSSVLEVLNLLALITIGVVMAFNRSGISDVRAFDLRIGLLRFAPRVPVQAPADRDRGAAGHE